MTLYKRPDSDLWWYEFQLAGKRYRGSTKTANKREAQAHEVDRRREAAEDQKQARLGVTRKPLWEIANSWLKASQLTLSDHANNESRVRKLFGDEKVQGRDGRWTLVEGNRWGIPKTLMIHEVTQHLLLQLREKRSAEGNSIATINREISLVQSLMGYAEAMGVVMPEKPIVWAGKRNRTATLKVKEPKGKLRWLTQPEERSLLTYLAERIKSEPLIGQDNLDLVTLLVDTGARYNEVAQLKWSQVNFDAGLLYLYRPKVDNEGGLHLTQRSLAILKRRRAFTFPRSFVFPGYNGRQYDRTDVPRGHATTGIQNAIDACGLNDDLSRGKATPHTLRDTFASRLVQAGVSLLKVSHLLGHADVTMTKKYAHLCPENTGREATMILDRLHGANECLEGDDPVRVPVQHLEAA